MVTKSIKYQQALVYFLTHCNNERLGVVKLNKLFYYLDFISFRDRGVSITGEVYVHLPKGPFAKNLTKQIDSAVKTGLLLHEEIESKKYGTRNSYQPLVKVDMTVFDTYEKKLLKSVSEYFADWSTDKMVAQTHTEAPWVFSMPSKEIDYSLADDIEILQNETVTA